MSKLNEIVVNHVFFKKNEGTLHLTHESITWKPKTENAFPIVYHYFQIKHLKISIKKNKAKILLGFYNLSWSIFEFCSPISHDKQLIDMIKCSDLIAILKPASRHKHKRIPIDHEKIHAYYKKLVFDRRHAAHIFWNFYYSNEKAINYLNELSEISDDE